MAPSRSQAAYDTVDDGIVSDAIAEQIITLADKVIPPADPKLVAELQAKIAQRIADDKESGW